MAIEVTDKLVDELTAKMFSTLADYFAEKARVCRKVGEEKRAEFYEYEANIQRDAARKAGD